MKRGEEIPRPNPWLVRAASLGAAKGWEQLVSQARSAVDDAWLRMTSNPRRTDDRQHQLKGSLGQTVVGGVKLDQWQIEVTSGGRIWYGIDDDSRTIWVVEARTGHPKATDTRRRGR